MAVLPSPYVLMRLLQFSKEYALLLIAVVYSLYRMATLDYATASTVRVVAGSIGASLFCVMLGVAIYAYFFRKS